MGKPVRGVIRIKGQQSIDENSRLFTERGGKRGDFFEVEESLNYRCIKEPQKKKDHF